ncbi:unnamed protein product [Ectocarpus fasciculatus]
MGTESAEMPTTFIRSLLRPFVYILKFVGYLAHLAAWIAFGFVFIICPTFVRLILRSFVYILKLVGGLVPFASFAVVCTVHFVFMLFFCMLLLYTGGTTFGYTPFNCTLRNVTYDSDTVCTIFFYLFVLFVIKQQPVFTVY